MEESVSVENVPMKEENIEEINKFVVFIFNLFEICAQAFVFVIFIFHFLFRTVSVDGSSMNNTLFDKDKLFIFSSFFLKPKQKDIVVLNTFDSLDALIVKRVIATEGQTVDIRRNGDHYDVYVDGVRLEEDYIKEPISPFHIGDLTYPLVVPKGHIFVLGDNRNDSRDSREFACFNLERVKGIALARITPVRSFTIFK